MGRVSAGLAAFAVWLLASVTLLHAEPVAVEGLHGTLLKPAGATTAVLIIAGSGPTDRDANSRIGLKTDTYKFLAETLAAKGLAVLRFDKRGVGESSKDRRGAPIAETTLTIQTFADDAATLATWLKGHPGITRVVLAGHSEGGLIALLAARAVTVDGLVLLTAPGRPLGVILRGQLGRQPLPDELLAEAGRVLSAIERGGDPGTIKPPFDQLFRPSVHPFLRSVLTLDPAPLVKAQAAPILVIGGGFDLQVGRFDYNGLVGARAGVTGAWVPRMTHMLKECADDDPAQVSAYTDPSVPLMPVVAETILKWLQK